MYPDCVDMPLAVTSPYARLPTKNIGVLSKAGCVSMLKAPEEFCSQFEEGRQDAGTKLHLADSTAYPRPSSKIIQYYEASVAHSGGLNCMPLGAGSKLSQ